MPIHLRRILDAIGFALAVAVALLAKLFFEASWYIAVALAVPTFLISVLVLSRVLALRTLHQMEAVVKATGTDDGVIADFGDFCARCNLPPGYFYDAGVLPHPKARIMQAIERQIVRERDKTRVNFLKNGLALLWNYQGGVGPTPLPVAGLDISNLPSGTSSADLDALKRALQNPNRSRDEARAKQFREIADAEQQQLEQRVMEALRGRR